MKLVLFIMKALGYLTNKLYFLGARNCATQTKIHKANPKRDTAIGTAGPAEIRNTDLEKYCSLLLERDQQICRCVFSLSSARYYYYY